MIIIEKGKSIRLLMYNKFQGHFQDRKPHENKIRHSAPEINVDCSINKTELNRCAGKMVHIMLQIIVKHEKKMHI